MARKRTISIGGATYDLFVRTATDVLETRDGQSVIALRLGHKIRVNGAIGSCGGGASNTAVGFARLGCDAGFSGILGDDEWGQALQRNFAKEGVDTAGATVVEDEVTSFSLVLSAESGERVILYHSGTNVHLHDATFGRETIKGADWVFLNHIQDRSCMIQDDIVELLAGNVGLRFSWNPGGGQIEAGLTTQNHQALLRATDLLLMNKEEALRFTKQSTVADALRACIAAGVQIVCVTDGPRGCTATDGQTLYECPGADAAVVDSTGAGDAFGTAMTWALMEGMSLPVCLQAGTINAASVIGSLGAQAGLLTDTDMHKHLQSSLLDVRTSDFS